MRVATNAVNRRRLKNKLKARLPRLLARGEVNRLKPVALSTRKTPGSTDWFERCGFHPTEAVAWLGRSLWCSIASRRRGRPSSRLPSSSARTQSRREACTVARCPRSLCRRRRGEGHGGRRQERERERAKKRQDKTVSEGHRDRSSVSDSTRVRALMSTYRYTPDMRRREKEKKAKVSTSCVFALPGYTATRSDRFSSTKWEWTKWDGQGGMGGLSLVLPLCLSARAERKTKTFSVRVTPRADQPGRRTRRERDGGLGMGGAL